MAHTPVRVWPLTQMCHAWADGFEAGARRAAPGGRSRSPGLGSGRPGAAHWRMPGCCCALICMATDSRRPAGAVAGHRPQAVCWRPGLRRAAAHAELRGQAGRRPSRPSGQDGRPGRGGRRQGAAVAVRPQRAGVALLAAHAPGGQAACARVDRRRLALSNTTLLLGVVVVRSQPSRRGLLLKLSAGLSLAAASDRSRGQAESECRTGLQQDSWGRSRRHLAQPVLFAVRAGKVRGRTLCSHSPAG